MVFCFILVVFFLYLLDSFVVAQIYIKATSTSAATLRQHSSFLANLQLAALAGDHSWLARLLHKNKFTLQKLKFSVEWFYFLKENKKIFFKILFLSMRAAHFFFNIWSKSTKAVSSRPFLVKKAASKALSRDDYSPQKPRADETIVQWVSACVTYYRLSDYFVLSKQFLLFLPYVAKNQQAFYAAFLRISAANLLLFSQIVGYIARQKLTQTQKQELALLMQLYYRAVHEIANSYPGLPGADLQLILNEPISLLLEANLTRWSSFELTCFECIKPFIRFDQLAVINSLLSAAKDMQVMRAAKFEALNVQTLVILTFEVFKPHNRFFLLENLIFSIKKVFVLLKLKAMPLELQVPVLLTILKKDFSFASILGSNLLRLIKLVLWLAFLVFVFLFDFGQPAYALTSVTSGTSFVGFGLGTILSVTFYARERKFKNNNHCRYVKVSASQDLSGSNEQEPSLQTPADQNQSQLTINKISSLKILKNWFVINHLGFIDPKDSAPFLVLKNRNLNVLYKNNSKGIKELRSGFHRRKTLIKFLKQKGTAQNLLLKQVHANLVSQKGPLKATFKQIPPTSAAFISFCICFLQTLMVNSNGKLSLCGTVYPYDNGDDVQNLFYAFFHAVKYSTADASLFSPDVKSTLVSSSFEVKAQSSTQSDLSASSSAMSDSLSDCVNSNAAFDDGLFDDLEFCEASFHTQQDSFNPDTLDYETQAFNSSVIKEVSTEATLSAERKALLKTLHELDLLDLFASYDQIETLADGSTLSQRMPETQKLQLAHLFPGRFYSALQYEKESFLCIILPQSLNGPVDQKVFAPNFWYTQTAHINNTWIYRLYTTDVQRLQHNYCTAIDRVLGSTLKNSAGKVAGFADILECQQAFLIASYKQAGSTYCGVGADQMKNLIQPFQSQIEIITQASCCETSTQQLLLHSIALEQISESCIKSLKHLIQTMFSLFNVLEPLEDLLADFQAAQGNQSRLDSFFENQGSFASLIRSIDSQTKYVLIGTNIAFLSAVWSYYEQTLGASVMLRLRSSDNGLGVMVDDPSVPYPLITFAGTSIPTTGLFSYAKQLHKSYISCIIGTCSEITQNAVLFTQGLPSSYELVYNTDELGQIVLGEYEARKLMELRREFARFIQRRLEARLNSLITLDNQREIFFTLFQLSGKIRELWQKGATEINLETLNELFSELKLGFSFESARLGRKLPGSLSLQNVWIPLNKGRLDYHVLLANFPQFREVFRQSDSKNFFEVGETPSEQLTGSVTKTKLVQPTSLDV